MGYALPLDVTGNRLVSGTVQTCRGNDLLIAGESGLLRAVRAESCLLAPQRGDRVLVALLDSGEAWVLSVLQRHGKEAELHLPKRTTLRAEELNIQAGRAGLDASSLTLRGDDVKLEGKRMEIRSRLLVFGGQVLLQGFAVMQTVAHKLAENIVRRSSRYGSLKENVDDLAERRAGRVRMDSRTTLRVRSENADIRAKGQMDLDAEHIKVG